MAARFCPKCGSSFGPFIGSFCKKCFLSDNKLIRLPEEIAVQRCRSCRKVLLRGKWERPTNKKLSEFVLQKTKTKGLEGQELSTNLLSPSNPFNLEVCVKGSIEGVEVSECSWVEIALQPTTCSACSKIRAGYHEATIQLRSEDQKKAKKALFFAKRLLGELSAKDPLARVIATERKKHGLDLLIGSAKASHQIVRSLSKKFGGKMKRSTKVVGATREGKARKRFYYSIRL